VPGSATEFTDQQAWNRARNQQRNWETLQQLLSLPTQIISATVPVRTLQQWQFEFEVETPEVYGPGLVLLQADCDGVPMLTGLDELAVNNRVLIAQGPDQNLWFKPI